MSDLTVIYYTANKISDYFFQNTKKQLLLTAQGMPIISVSQKPMDLGKNICMGDIGYNSLNIYKQVLVGAKSAKTKYIAMAEDDVLYSPEHFAYIPQTETFTYNMNVETIYTWNKNQCFIYKNRRALHSLICGRELFITAMEERFSKYPDAADKPDWWSEPGKSAYERRLGVKRYGSIQMSSKIPNIVFCAPQMLGFGFLGYKKKLGDVRKTVLPYWGKIEDIIKLYKDP